LDKIYFLGLGKLTWEENKPGAGLAGRLIEIDFDKSIDHESMISWIAYSVVYQFLFP
jgi:hypothetical protein